MERILECSFYWNSKTIGMGLGLGICDIDSRQTICNGDLNYCEKPSASCKSQVEQYGNGKDRRRHPRAILDLPLEYRLTNAPHAHGALVVNGSEIGLLIECVNNIVIGPDLNIAVFFSKRFQISNFEVIAQVVRKEICLKENWEGYQYGLQFIRISKDNHWKLRQLLGGRYDLNPIISNWDKQLPKGRVSSSLAFQSRL